MYLARAGSDLAKKLVGAFGLGVLLEEESLPYHQYLVHTLS